MKKWLLQFGSTLFLAVFAISCADRSEALLKELSGNRPADNQFVVDRAGVFSGRERAALNNVLNDVLVKTDTVIVVVTVESLMGGEIDDFAARLYEAWGIGKKGVDKGALILTAIEDRKVRIEVGYGLEPVLTDAAAGRIIDSVIIPFFRAGRFSEGLVGGAVAVANYAGYESGVEPLREMRTNGEFSPFAVLTSLLFVVVFLILAARHPFLAMLLLSSMRGGGSRGGGGFGSGGFGGFGGGMSGGGGASRSW